MVRPRKSTKTWGVVLQKGKRRRMGKGTGLTEKNKKKQKHPTSSGHTSDRWNWEVRRPLQREKYLSSAVFRSDCPYRE